MAARSRRLSARADRAHDDGAEDEPATHELERPELQDLQLLTQDRVGVPSSHASEGPAQPRARPPSAAPSASSTLMGAPTACGQPGPTA